LAGCEKFQESKDIGKFPGNQEQIGLDEKKIPENGGNHQTVLAGGYQERTHGQRTGAFTMAPEHDLGLNPPSSQRPHCQTLQEQKLHSRTLSPFAVMPSGLLTESTEPVEGNKGSLDQSRSMDQEEKRDVPMHLPRSQEVLPFGITKKESLEESPTDQEDLMRPTSSSQASRENENGEGAEQQPLSKTVISPVHVRRQVVWIRYTVPGPKSYKQYQKGMISGKVDVLNFHFL
jgi:hypothetical protein